MIPGGTSAVTFEKTWWGPHDFETPAAEITLAEEGVWISAVAFTTPLCLTYGLAALGTFPDQTLMSSGSGPCAEQDPRSRLEVGESRGCDCSIGVDHFDVGLQLGFGAARPNR